MAPSYALHGTSSELGDGISSNAVQFKYRDEMEMLLRDKPNGAPDVTGGVADPLHA